MKDDPLGRYRIWPEVRDDILTLPVPESGGDPVEVELIHCPCDWVGDVLLGESRDGHFLVAYLVHDEDARSPLKNDGMGEIHGTEGDRESLRSALAMTDSTTPALDLTCPTSKLKRDYLDVASYRLYGCKFMDLYTVENQENKVITRAAQMWEKDLRAGKIGNPLAILLNFNSYASNVSPIAHLGNCRISDLDAEAVWIPDDCCKERIEELAFAHLLPPDYRVEYRSGRGFSNRITVVYPDGSCQGGYQSFGQAARSVLTRLGIRPSRATLLRAQREVALEMARSICEEYSFWLDGEAFGIVTEVFDSKGHALDEHDACWGYLGIEHAKQSMVADHFLPKWNSYHLVPKQAPLGNHPEQPKLSLL